MNGIQQEIWLPAVLNPGIRWWFVIPGSKELVSNQFKLVKKVWSSESENSTNGYRKSTDPLTVNLPTRVIIYINPQTFYIYSDNQKTVE